MIRSERCDSNGRSGTLAGMLIEYLDLGGVEPPAMSRQTTPAGTFPQAHGCGDVFLTVAECLEEQG